MPPPAPCREISRHDFPKNVRLKTIHVTAAVELAAALGNSPGQIDEIFRYGETTTTTMDYE